MLRFALHLSVALLLTILTQLGGVAYLIAILIARSSFARIMAFLCLFVWAGIGASFIAPSLGRVPLACNASADPLLHARSRLYCVMNRHYVSVDLLTYATQLAATVNAVHPGTSTLTLDAGFPFLDGMPLLPHLSHDDGQKLDIAFYYTDASGVYQPGLTPSPIGYWGFEDPAPDAPDPCGDTTGLSLRWDMGWLQGFMRDLPLDETRTRTALRWIAENPPTGGKVFVEPHLAERLGISAPHIRFQGCRAARHDDHIHIEIAP